MILRQFFVNTTFPGMASLALVSVLVACLYPLGAATGPSNSPLSSPQFSSSPHAHTSPLTPHTSLAASQFSSSRRAVPRQHPYLLGTREQLRSLAKLRPAEYQRVVQVARSAEADDYSKIMSVSLVAAIDNDQSLGREAQRLAMKYVNGPIRAGHVTFGTDLALCGFAYDLCQESWPEADRLKLIEYINKTVAANVDSERSVFHNAWYGYKNWGIGVASYATYHENPKAAEHLRVLEEDYQTRAVPALKHAGDGGGWAEGYYIHYWLYEWLVFCEVARRVEGVDYYVAAPEFYRQRPVAAMFEAYPGLSKYNTRQSMPMGDGGGRLYGGDRDKDLCARRILVSQYRDDAAAQAVHAFNEITPRMGSGSSAYKDFLWHDTTVRKGDLKAFKLSHYSPGAGFVYARSSWDEDATAFFFKCGDRFTAHQHLDVGTFLIYKHAELAGDGGHYTDFGGAHDVNYHLRTIAHNTMLILDPQERWPANIRAGKSVVNDGGQNFPWKHHNGAIIDPVDWEKQKTLCDIGEMLEVKDHGDYLHVAGDATRAYSTNKLEQFTRQIVFIRPGTFVIFDRVRSAQPEFQKTWLLQAMNTPKTVDGRLVMMNDQGKLTVQTLLPEAARIRLVSGKDLYAVNGKTYPPRKNTGPAPECRIEISPSAPSKQDYFLHVLAATHAQNADAPRAESAVKGNQVTVKVAGKQLVFRLDEVALEVASSGTP